MIDPLATAIEDLALETPEDYLMAAPDSDDAMGQVADLCSLLLVTLEPRWVETAEILGPSRIHCSMGAKRTYFRSRSDVANHY